jgi:DNA-binding transcriptional MerR regulator
MTQNKTKPQKKNLLRIGQLVKKAGVSAPTIKHYVKEGLLPQPVKTSRNMAYYDDSCVERINLIKRIQKERFLPLDVIKRLIESGEYYDEELELGRAILKSHKEPVPTKLVKGSQVERVSGYALDKIMLLEEDGLIFPTVKNNVKYYDEMDLEIIDVIKRREKLGLPFHLSLETVRIYRDSLTHAVYSDIRLFIKNFLGDVPTKQAIKFLTETDDQLDRFLVLFRYQKLRSIRENALKEMNALPGSLNILNIFPVECRQLPESPPDDSYFKIIFYLCQAKYDSAIRVIKGDLNIPDFAAFTILSALLKGDTADTLNMVDKYIAKPTTRALDNTVAALAYLSSTGKAKGLSTPMYHTKKVIDYLKRIEIFQEMDPLISLFSQFVTGAVYTLLPEVVETRREGITLLEKLKTQINNRKIKTGRLPKWLIRTLDFEIFPALQIRINRFLAGCYLNQVQYDEAIACLEKIIEIADPDSEHAVWAHMTRLGIKS